MSRSERRPFQPELSPLSRRLMQHRAARGGSSLRDHLANLRLPVATALPANPAGVRYSSAQSEPQQRAGWRVPNGVAAATDTAAPRGVAASTTSACRGDDSSATRTAALVRSLWARFRETGECHARGRSISPPPPLKEEEGALTAAGLARLVNSLTLRTSDAMNDGPATRDGARAGLFEKFSLALGLDHLSGGGGDGNRCAGASSVAFPRFSAVFTVVLAKAACGSTEQKEEAEDSPLSAAPSTVSERSTDGSSDGVAQEGGSATAPTSPARPPTPSASSSLSSHRSSPAPRPPVALFAASPVDVVEYCNDRKTSPGEKEGEGSGGHVTRLCSPPPSCSPFACSSQPPGLSESPAVPPTRLPPTPRQRREGKGTSSQITMTEAASLPSTGPPRAASTTTRSFELKRSAKRVYDPQHECTFTPNINKKAPLRQLKQTGEGHRGAIRYPSAPQQGNIDDRPRVDRQRRVLALVDIDGVSASSSTTAGSDGVSSATITICEGDDPHDLALDFCDRHRLGSEVSALLERLLRQRLGELLS